MRKDVTYYIRRLRIAHAIRAELRGFEDASGRMPLRPEAFRSGSVSLPEWERRRLDLLLVRNTLGFSG